LEPGFAVLVATVFDITLLQTLKACVFRESITLCLQPRGTLFFYSPGGYPVFDLPRSIRDCLVAALSLVLLACSQAPQTPSEPSHAAVRQEESTSAHDLSADEEMGGHTLQRHIGRTDAELQERLERERHISAASTYTDRETAEHVVAEAIRLNQDRIQRWLQRPGGHPNLVLDYHGDQPVGRVLNRGESHSVPCSNAVVVLKWAGPNRYYVLTSYPECR
jgi:Bacterial CdiA-CT RNAse A domain